MAGRLDVSAHQPAADRGEHVPAPRDGQARSEAGAGPADDHGHRAGRADPRADLSGQPDLFRQPEHVVLLPRRRSPISPARTPSRWDSTTAGGVAGPNQAYALQPVSYRFNNGVPNQITLERDAVRHDDECGHDLGVYAQDRWTLNRLTLTLGVRYDYFADSFPEQTVGPALLAPNRNITFPGSGQRQLARHHAEVRRRLRSVRQRQDRGEGELEQIPAGHAERRGHDAQSGEHHRHQHDEIVDRREPELHARLRSRPIPRRRTTGRPAAISAGRWPMPTSARWCPARPSIPTPCAAGASATTTGSSPPACSSSSPPACRPTSATSGAGTATSPSPTTW